MTRHLLKLLWNRKRASALIVLEIVMSFLVLAAVLGGVAHFTINWNRPLGYDARNAWNLAVDIPPGEATQNREATNARFLSIIREVAATPGVESAAGIRLIPYGLGDWSSEFGEGDARSYHLNSATDEFAETMGLEIVEGRWFGPEDNGVDSDPVVLNQEAVRLYFPQGIAMGDVINPNADGEERRMRVVGIIREFRKAGELQSPEPYAFMRANLEDERTLAPESIVFRVAPDSSTELEVAILETARRVAPDWSFEIRPLSVMRRGALRLQFAPIIAGAVIAGSMILLVALGLTGVIWQNVTRRTKEIGLRRAVGAPAAGVRSQILAETLIIASIGLVAGLLIAVQAPLSGMLPDVRPEVLGAGVGGAILMILVIVTLCAIYPARLASSVEPAEALHYE